MVSFALQNWGDDAWSAAKDVVTNDPSYEETVVAEYLHVTSQAQLWAERPAQTFPEAGKLMVKEFDRFDPRDAHDDPDLNSPRKAQIEDLTRGPTLFSAKRGLVLGQYTGELVLGDTKGDNENVERLISLDPSRLGRLCNAGGPIGTSSTVSPGGQKIVDHLVVEVPPRLRGRSFGELLDPLAAGAGKQAIVVSITVSTGP